MNTGKDLLRSIETTWVGESAQFLAFSTDIPGLFTKDRTSAMRARRSFEEQVRALLIANEM
ncbi:hypothetical protein [Nocardia stercoris]|uniref:Uncharacterized protein n=1 Tax=Nocardia stercoris TaxID=2483361 RepID=A0A3M2KUE4_9NOCA|nr:hypothetical protein [Nocardia stercoris]RMI27853.1 hypothetical protein EBN03_32455 [Nocardia stercoris]